jgi:hypothetical protein
VGPRRFLARVLTGTFLGLLALYAYAAGLHPTPLRLDEIGGDDLGRYVEVAAHVRRVEGTRSGGVSLHLVDLESFATLRAFVPRAAWAAFPGRMATAPGAGLLARGELQGFGEEVVLQVESPSDLVLLHAAEENRMPVQTLASRAPELVGLGVSVRGALADIREIIDPTRLRLDTPGGELWIITAEAPPGLLDLCGRMEWNPRSDRWEVVVAPGDVAPSPATLDCPSISTEDLMANPEAYRDERVGLWGILLGRGELVGTAFTLRDGASTFAGFLPGQPLPAGLVGGIVVDFTATVEYHEAEGRYRLAGTAASLRAV